MSVYFISDLHLGHKKILEFSVRFGDTVEEHDSILVDRINSRVAKRDKLYVLGDVAFSDSGAERFKDVQCQNKELIIGNHDIPKRIIPLFEKVHGFREYREFWLSHCPIHPHHLRDRKNIHGHTHNNLVVTPDGKPDDRYINVCVEQNDGFPVRYEDII